MTKARVLIIAGYFDWFSGYQETSLAQSLTKHADVSVLAGTHVNPGFSADHLDNIGHPRSYPPGLIIEHGVTIRRIPTFSAASMQWSWRAASLVRDSKPDLIIQVMPGQLLPAAASLVKTTALRVALYGDNSAMYAELPPWKQYFKFRAFCFTKGQLYKFVNRRADTSYGYTPNTIDRLRPFEGARPMELLPLTYDDQVFGFNPRLRRQTRVELGLNDGDFAVIAPGKVRYRKRLHLLLDAMETSHIDERTRIIIVGADSSEDSRALRDRATRSHASSRVRILGFASAVRLNALFNAADLGIWPSMPAITIQQAMGTGLPVALPHNDLVGHLVRDSNHGLFMASNPTGMDVANAIQTSARRFPPLIAERQARAQHSAWLSSTAIAEKLMLDTRWHR